MRGLGRVAVSWVLGIGFGVAFLGAGVPAGAALQILGYDPARHDRFYVGTERAFLAEAFDWSGVGRRTDSNAHWATMVSPRYFLSAEHFHPGPGATLRFFHRNDPAGSYEDHVVESGVRIGLTDIWLGRLATPVSPEVALYPIASFASDADYADQPIFVFGLSSTQPPETSVRVGVNAIDWVAGPVLSWSYDEVGGVGPDEAQTVTGDSGAPSFLIVGGVPALVGTHWRINQDAFLAGATDAIAAEMQGETLQVLVPECGDGEDNDGDGAPDYPEDPGCTSAIDLTERSPLLPCDDGIDNDGDGRVDFDPATRANPGDVASLPAGVGDPGCKDPEWPLEDPPCQNGLDDDEGDPALDYDGGLSANGIASPFGRDRECVRPWHVGEGPDCGEGYEAALLAPVVSLVYRRRRRRRAR